MTTPEPTEALDHFEQWLFNLELECSGASLAPLESIAIGGAVLKLPDLLAGIKAARDKERDVVVAFLRGRADIPSPSGATPADLQRVEYAKVIITLFADALATNQHRTDHV